MCSCGGCGIDDIDMLTIDHIAEDGAGHRKLNGAVNIYSWLIKNKFPSGYQVLCMNHNLKKSLVYRRKNRLCEVL